MLNVSMGKLLRPTSIAVIGASAKPGNVGGRIVGELEGCGYQGQVYAIHPRAERVLNAEGFAEVGSISSGVDFAALCVPDDALVPTLESLASDGVKGFFIPSRAFDRASGSHTKIPDAMAAIARASDLAICGHNCMGFVNFRDKVTMTFGVPATDAKPGGVCVVSQSGSTWSGIVGSQRDLGFDIIVSAGGEIATGVADYLEYFVSLPETRVIGLVIETIREPERFIAALSEAERRGIPVVGLFVGLSEAGARFTAAHSGGLASPRQILDAISRQHGLIVTKNPDEFLDCIEVFRTDRRPMGHEAAIVSDSGGERQLIADVSSRTGLILSQFTSQTEQALTDILDPGMVVGNPIDCYGDGQLLMSESGIIAARDPNVTLVGVGTNLVHGRKFLETTSSACVDIYNATDKPVIVFGNMSSTVSREGARKLREKDIPVLMGTETACYAIGQFIGWHFRQLNSGADRAAVDISPARIVQDFSGLSTHETLVYAQNLGLPVAPFVIADNAADLLKAAERIGFPLVLKTANSEIAHKTEAGGVIVNIRDRRELEQAYEGLAARCGPLALSQPFLTADFELIVGMYRDERFGPVITVGLGGIFTEILKDSVSMLLPLDERDLRQATATLRAAGVLNGARGRKGISHADLLHVVRIVGAIAEHNPSVTGIDFNPIMVSDGKMSIVDMLVTTE
ncbi:acyl-CoA synthetase (NDP forming) [Ochrobactrum daejeonense]|uniref:Acyl-CoA synthetase (NDP forming) n=1 Tax=Brucella daejeonensis TaxID=659015 RepID=A0A7W9B0F6_9HYPH|nr:acetate--CoA ligase family protein [Brucella daejeonensis]MBB5703937.1 acyl-CoA synthetase (NDP forming) [Brucella daejeonensis]